MNLVEDALSLGEMAIASDVMFYIYTAPSTCSTYILYFSVTCLIAYIFANIFISTKTNANISGKRVLVITAHPDDECMFFAPAIIELAKHNQVSVLSTTTGNYYGQGRTRSKELVKSCEILGIAQENVEVLDNEHFPDDPSVEWDEGELSTEISQVIKKRKPQIVLTFDSGGVSGHANHITTYNVVRQLVHNGGISLEATSVYQLESVFVLRKYISLLDLPHSLISCMAGHTLIFVSSPSALLQAQRAMFAHKSQLIWFRYLYIVFSRYMLINTFTPVLS